MSKNFSQFTEIEEISEGTFVVGYDHNSKEEVRIPAERLAQPATNLSIANGEKVPGQYVAGMIYQDGVFSLIFAPLPTPPSKSDWKTQVAPTGTINGVNRTFTIPESIVAGTEEVIVNGQVLTRGIDYTISAATITLAADAYIPSTGDIIRVNYIKA